MERSRLKNIIILILALTNVFLLVSLAMRTSAARSARERTAEELVALFKADGVSLSPDAISDAVPPAERTLTRDTTLDRSLAAALLGDTLAVTDEGGGIYTYSDEQGKGSFRANGSFTVTGQLLSGDAESACRAFCKTFGYQSFSSSIQDGSGTASAVQYFNGYPVANCTVAFRAEGNVLVSVSGTHIPETFTTTGTSGAMTAATALTRFLEFRRTSGAVVSAVTGLNLCYQLQSTAAVPLELVPAWQVETDTVSYYVNCSTGAVTRG